MRVGRLRLSKDGDDGHHSGGRPQAVGYPAGAVTARQPVAAASPADAERSGATARAVPTEPGTVPDRPLDADDAGAPRPAPDGSRRRVLMVLFHFPPLGGVAIPRNVRNVEHLPRFGWEPVVISARDAGGPLDPDTLALVPPGTRVFRALCPEPRDLRRFVDPARGLKARLRPPRRTPDAGEPDRQEHAADPGAARPAPPFLWRLYHAVSFPDGQVGWLPFALAAAARTRRAGGFDVVYSTSAPITAHLVAGIVSRLAGVPWVAEFRDPWLGSPLGDAPGARRSWLHRRLQVKVERWIARSADRLVFVSPSTTRLYRRRYPAAAEMVTITNGHDRGELPSRPAEAAPRTRRRIVWAGTLNRPDELEVLLRALDALAARRPTLADELEVVFYGDVSDPCRAVAERFASGLPLGAVLRFERFVPRREALSAIADADFALLMLGDGAGMGQYVPGKLFDYIGHARQLLAILPPGDARDILEELGWGVVASPNIADVERALELILTAPPPARVADPDGRYDRVALVGRLAETLRAATEAAPGRETPRGRTTSGAER